ncbi:ARS-binding protein 2 [Fulvia fulva]|uniref:ARS-binding protein 2 n=1 Tax=Passalora fulva TaxID=5499 RepID=A0A9Q8P4V9_PASFU|nr:ARS-binding protein 2 [Fulvia fulva]KAK4630847.1 ARS-binding protein 2 [Fulvia fulva]KAK4633082.1 ARS-binding protein 2 [Fulvia fulva]UJO13274.1 ARS-binding protein 2 [Fulvia fulva]WPV10927.1 ARS-binding protein 2 [Fulvia fulva]WPV25753.1 ARS-binding protein 2 [Fulvia fulva]
MYRQQHGGAGADQQYHGTAIGHFASPVFGIDPALHDSQHLLQPTSNATPTRQSPHRRISSNEGLMQPPNTSSPRNSPAPNYKPRDRARPPRHVTAETITDTFVNFILYCNPNFPLDVDTSALRTNFQSPPKSDSKDFDTFRLFELVKKLDAKEIKTWGQLALDLGVEAPDIAKGQSTQKVQQYSVRLKRWMRATHIDAFFEYLLGKQHSYFNEIPHPSDPYPTTGRDGVMAEEDLAIRALDPSFRPKRGRRRNSETEQDEAADTDQPHKQPRLNDNTSSFSAVPNSAVPMSAHPDSFNDPWAVASAVTPQSFAPWSGRLSASAVSATSNLRWQLSQSQNPSTPHPMSAVPGSMSARIDAAFDGKPKSAVTPSSRRRRRHGPAVSSAWPSNNTPGAKPRGRPPANRNVQDGPFGTFPADPTNDKSKGHVQEPKSAVELPTPQTVPPTYTMPEGRPGRLSLQVPPHQGGPVRLATPPALQVNGEHQDLETRSDSDDPSRASMMMVPAVQGSHVGVTIVPDDAPPSFSFEALKRVVASDLLRATMLGRRQRLTGDEAKRLADAVLDRLAVPRSESGPALDDLARLTAASWLGVGDQYGVPLGPSAGHGKRIQVTRFRTDAAGYEEITYDEDEEGVRELFDLSWHVSQGGCMGTFEMKGLSIAGPPAPEPETTHDMILRKGLEALRRMDSKDLRNVETENWLEKNMLDVARSVVQGSTGNDDNVDWKAKYRAMEFGANVAKGEVKRVRQRMLEKVLDALL